MAEPLAAGPELDALVFERVFGAERCATPWRDPYSGDLYHHRIRNTDGLPPTWLYDEPEHYSTTWEGMQLVVERMMVEGWALWSMKNDWQHYEGGHLSETRCWRAMFGKLRQGSIPSSFGEGEADTAPLAVCRAALKALAPSCQPGAILAI